MFLRNVGMLLQDHTAQQPSPMSVQVAVLSEGSCNGDSQPAARYGGSEARFRDPNKTRVTNSSDVAVRDIYRLFQNYIPSAIAQETDQNRFVTSK
jgi:hypothetical protein